MSDDERAVLVFEEQHPKNDRRKEAAVREKFDVSWVRYQQRLLRLAKREDVLAEFAIVAHRVMNRTEAGAAARSSRSFLPR